MSNLNAAADTVSRHRVLIVDDSPETIDVVTRALASEFQVLATTRPEKALTIALEKSPELILLDVIMPEIDGYQVCEQLKRHEMTRHIPVIFITGLGSEGDEVKGFSMGAVDYVTKPVEPVILLSRVRTQIELSETRSALRAANQHLSHERELMAQMIMGMREDSNFCFDDLEFASQSHDSASGDLLLSARRPNGDHHVLVGDFTGHGLPAAIGSPLVTHLFYSNTLDDRPMDEVLATINDVLCQRLPTHIFMAAVAACIRRNEPFVQIWNCGSPDVLHLDGQGRWTHLQSTELPMGVIPSESPYAAESISVERGDRLYVMTDGPIEADCRDGNMFGVERVQRALQSEADNIRAVLEQVTACCKDPAALDDMTLLRICRGSKDSNHD